jgi:hypothetical protein
MVTPKPLESWRLALADTPRYILNADGNPEPREDIQAWSEWMTTVNRVMADEQFADGDTVTRVSSEFIGIDQNFHSGGLPVLWETRVVGGELSGERLHYTSSADAWRGHVAMCQRVRDTVIVSDPVRCHCGQLLHYSSSAIQRQVEELNARAGNSDMVVTINRRSWRVQRHYIALHGIKAVDLPTLGFLEIPQQDLPVDVPPDTASFTEVFDATLDDRQRVTLVLDYGPEGDRTGPRLALYINLSITGIVLRLMAE